MKDKLVIGIHTLECFGATKEARYRDIINKKFDGVHLYGPSGMKAYTISVLNILNIAGIFELTDGQSNSAQEFYKNLLQYEYQKRKTKVGNHSAKTQNNSANDRDIRRNRINASINRNDRYAVPTSNLFDHLNY